MSILKRLSKSWSDLTTIFTRNEVEIDINNSSEQNTNVGEPLNSCSVLKSGTKKVSPPSLANIGANCYLNSALQSISSCEKFKEDIKRLHSKYKDLDKLTLFHNLMIVLNNGSKNAIEISRNNIFRHWNKSGQQDSFELLAYVINQVYNEIRNHSEVKNDISGWLRIRLPMKLLIQYSIKCSCGTIISIPLHSDLALHISVPRNGNETLERCLDQHFTDDIILNYICDTKSCAGLNALKMTKLLRPLPQTLCIHLQKSYWNGYQMKKINNRINFSAELIIKSEYCHTIDEIDSELLKSISNNSSITFSKALSKSSDSEKSLIGKGISLQKSFPSIKDNVINNLRLTSINSGEHLKQKKNILYNLCSVIVHKGNVKGGHYMCYKCIDNQWYLADDNQISKVRKEIVFKSDPYILIYEEK